jgi:hypothetical protein
VRLPGPQLTRDDHQELDWLIGRLEKKLKDWDMATAKVA